MSNVRQSAGLSYIKRSWYVLIMASVFPYQSLLSALRVVVSVLPNYSKFAGLANIRIQCQLPEFSGVFCEGDMPLEWPYGTAIRQSRDDIAA